MSKVKEIKFAIITPTYWKLDGSTKHHLSNTLKSVASQTYQNYKVYLIGDDYQKEDELYSLSEIIDKDKIYVENLPIAVEREKYSGRELWACGGSNATNVGERLAVKEGYNYICQLNHDDLFYPDHLETLSCGIKETGKHFLTTKCGLLPSIKPEGLYTSYRPIGNGLFVVSACYDIYHYPVSRRSIKERIKIYNHIYAGDADVWNQINDIMKGRDEWGVFINKTTCCKIGGKVPINNPEIVK